MKVIPLAAAGQACEEAGGEVPKLAPPLTRRSLLRGSGLAKDQDAAASDNAFISDGSQLTSGGAENPTLTIATLAIRQAEYIAGQMSQRAIQMGVGR